MNKTYIKSSNNTWANCIVLPDDWSGADGEWQLPDGHVFVDGSGGTGFVWNGSVFNNPNALTADEITAINWATFRAIRNSLLADCDWTQASDSPLNDGAKSEWAVHRQLLRDLPASTEDPDDPTWPDAPE